MRQGNRAVSGQRSWFGAPQGADGGGTIVSLRPAATCVLLEAAEHYIAALNHRIEAKSAPDPGSVCPAHVESWASTRWSLTAPIAEIGVDMSVFLSVYHRPAWAGVCPCNHVKKRRQAEKWRRPQGLRRSRVPGSARRRHFRRVEPGEPPRGQVPCALKARRGAMRAALADRSQDLCLLPITCSPRPLAKRRTVKRPTSTTPPTDPNRRRPQTTYRVPRLQRQPSNQRPDAGRPYIDAEAESFMAGLP